MYKALAHGYISSSVTFLLLTPLSVIIRPTKGGFGGNPSTYLVFRLWYYTGSWVIFVEFQNAKDILISIARSYGSAEMAGPDAQQDGIQ